MIDAQGDLRAELGPGWADIVAMPGSGKTLSLVETALDGAKAVLLSPGQAPFAKPAGLQLSPLARTTPPGASAGPSGIADSAALRRNFAETGRGFSW
jgi:hypothetical protein